MYGGHLHGMACDTLRPPPLTRVRECAPPEDDMRACRAHTMGWDDEDEPRERETRSGLSRRVVRLMINGGATELGLQEARAGEVGFCESVTVFGCVLR